MRSRPRLDASQAQIVVALRNMGCAVQSLASIGKGVPDLLISKRGRLALAEVKDGSKPPSQRRLTEDEQKWIKNWQSPVHILNSVDDAVKLVQDHL